MSLALVVLAVSASYLMQKQVKMTQKLQETMQVVNEAVEPEDKGPSTSLIRKTQRTVDDSVRFDSMNIQDLTVKDTDHLNAERARVAKEVAVWESPSEVEIQGVYLQRGV